MNIYIILSFWTIEKTISNLFYNKSFQFSNNFFLFVLVHDSIVQLLTFVYVSFYFIKTNLRLVNIINMLSYHIIKTYLCRIVFGNLSLNSIVIVQHD